MEFLDFINKAPSKYHAVAEICSMLDKSGFIKLDEKKKFNIEYGKKYYVCRNLSSVIAFTIPNKLDSYGFNITAAHTDSPTFRLKPNYDLELSGYQMLNTEVYGGPILNTFFDRPLNIAGRVMVNNNGIIESRLLSFDKFMCVIPNLCIHFNKSVNKGVELNPQIDCVPLLGDKDSKSLNSLIAKKLNVKEEDIISHDLFLAILDRGSIGGINDDLIMAPQIDNLECSFALTKAIIGSKQVNNRINVMALFDSEEIGSMTRTGADSKLLEDTLYRISSSLNKSYDDHITAINNSFMVSADNAHALHPSYVSKYDPTNRAYMNKGIAIKTAARGSYTTDGYSEAVFKKICDRVGAKYQSITNRSDVPGGGTLGAISLAHISIPSVDIGLPQLAMHSAMETCGKNDIYDMIKAITEYYSIELVFDDENIEIR